MEHEAELMNEGINWIKALSDGYKCGLNRDDGLLSIG